jgi:hypothetical protein
MLIAGSFALARFLPIREVHGASIQVVRLVDHDFGMRRRHAPMMVAPDESRSSHPAPNEL